MCPLSHANGGIVETLFAKTQSFFKNSEFDFGNGYFGNGQTLFLDGIMMDIMVDDGEIS